jgi:hypothetical protein
MGDKASNRLLTPKYVVTDVNILQIAHFKEGRRELSYHNIRLTISLLGDYFPVHNSKNQSIIHDCIDDEDDYNVNQSTNTVGPL